MATSYSGKDNSMYVQLKGLIHTKIKKTIVNNTISNKILEFCVKAM